MNGKRLALAFAVLYLLLCPAAAHAFGGDVTFDGGGVGGGASDSGTWLGDDSSGNSLAPMGVFLVIVFVVSRKNEKEKKARLQELLAQKAVDEESLEELARCDPSFSKSGLEKMVRTWVKEFEEAWCNRSMEPYEALISGELFHSYQEKLDRMERFDQLPQTTKLEILACTAERWERDGPDEFLYVWLDEKKRTFEVEAGQPDKVTQGNRKTTYRLLYRWQLVRRAGEGGWRLNHVEKIGQVS